MTPDSTGVVGLYATSATVGPNEVFTAWYNDAGAFGIKAPNGKFITTDRTREGTLVADREFVAEWEQFELVDAGNGLFALKGTNGKYVCAHYDLPGAHGSQLIADRPDAHEWELFTLVRDPAIGQ